ncbi:type II secretion system F family protein [candidate division KSB1 bacterium]|nr:type II secretion system F family protein [candidate division KSB1 bacterium]
MTLTLIAFFCAISLITGLIVAVIGQRIAHPRREIARRVNKFSQDSVVEKPAENPILIRNDQLSEIPLLQRILEKLNISSRLRELIRKAGSEMKVGELVLRMLIMGAAGFAVSLLLRNTLLGVILTVFLGFAPLIHLIMQAQKRLRSFICQFPDALDMMTSALRAGHALNQALQLIGNEAPEPLGPEFKRTFEQYNLGLDLRDALINLSERIPSLDLKLFVTAILLQRETGGNLTEILENISYTIRERFKLIGQIRTYTAQGRMSGWILGCLPIIFVVIISLLNPEYLSPLFEEKLGHKLIFSSVFLQIMGFYVIRKIVRVRYQ